jgi:CubicO group peptidase (beta-lactamase class C family)
VEHAQIELHSFMLVRRGHVVAEGWWTPYRANANHWLYSLTKSFTSTAVGFAVSEGRLTVQDRVFDFFPSALPATMSERLGALRVRDLLTMSAGHADWSDALVAKQEDWVRAFLALPMEKPPGSAFYYDSMATYMLSAIVQRVSGQTLMDYLQPQLFAPLGLHGLTCETCPRGISTGGWGLSATTEVVAKFGQFYLQSGKWNGRQLLPSAWVEEATSFKIQQPPSYAADPADDLEELKRIRDWHQGYCY